MKHVMYILYDMKLSAYHFWSLSTLDFRNEILTLIVKTRNHCCDNFFSQICVALNPSTLIWLFLYILVTGVTTSGHL